jgi:hypothetical protein
MLTIQKERVRKEQEVDRCGSFLMKPETNSFHEPNK